MALSGFSDEERQEILDRVMGNPRWVNGSELRLEGSPVVPYYTPRDMDYMNNFDNAELDDDDDDVGEWSEEDAAAEDAERQSEFDSEDGGNDDNAMAEAAFYTEEFGLDDGDDGDDDDDGEEHELYAENMDGDPMAQALASQQWDEADDDDDDDDDDALDPVGLDDDYTSGLGLYS